MVYNTEKKLREAWSMPTENTKEDLSFWLYRDKFISCSVDMKTTRFSSISLVSFFLYNTIFLHDELKGNREMITPFQVSFGSIISFNFLGKEKKHQK